MQILAKTRLQIKDQGELLNQIAGTYKDFFRAAMEYIDNSIDAAEGTRQAGGNLSAKIYVEVDAIKKTVAFLDNCGGMSPQELCELLSNVGRSKKKTAPWANGQFGFGVHAFRAFANEATFISNKKGFDEAMIVIDRNINENQDVNCIKTKEKQLKEFGSKIIISGFDAQVFKKAIFVKSLTAEIEHHFDDVLRAGAAKIFIVEKGNRSYECCFFNYSNLPGPAIKKSIPLRSDNSISEIKVDLKILDRAQENRLPVITNKLRRIQNISDLKSYKNYLRINGEISYIWNNPFLVGNIEINDFCSPNLTRDDLKDSKEREILYEKLIEIQKEAKQLLDDAMDKKTKDSFKKIGSIMSDCLAQILKKFRLEFEQLAPSGLPGNFEEHFEPSNGMAPFGGEDEPGGGGPGPNEKGSAGIPSEKGNAGVGDEDKGGGSGDLGKASGLGGASKERLIKSSGPRIDFQNHAGEGRVIDLGNSLIINLQHPDFIIRNSSGIGKIKLDIRLINYVSQVVSPFCVHRLFERKGKIPSVSEVGANVINLSLRLEQELVKTVLGEEIAATVIVQ